MTDAFYAAKRRTAASLLARYGMAMTLRDNEAGEAFDPDTGAVTGGVPVDYPVTGIVYPRAERGRAGSGERTVTQRVILSAEGLSVVPTKSHQLVVGGAVYEVVSVAPLAPGGVAVVYELVVQR